MQSEKNLQHTKYLKTQDIDNADQIQQGLNNLIQNLFGENTKYKAIAH